MTEPGDAAAAGRLRALPVALGGALHGGGRPARKAAARAVTAPARARVRRGKPDQRPDRGPHLAHDLPDDAEDRLRESVARVGKRPAGLLVTLFVNWLVKPFSMAFLGVALLPPRLRAVDRAELTPTSTSPGRSSWRPRPARRWSSSGPTSPTATRPTRSCRSPSTTSIMLVALRADREASRDGRGVLEVPFKVLLYVGPRLHRRPAAPRRVELRALAHARAGAGWFEKRFLPPSHPVTVAALLATLVLIFAFQADNITGRCSTCC